MGKVMTSARSGTWRALALAAIFAGGVAFPVGSRASAETGAWVESAHAKVRLVSAVSAYPWKPTRSLSQERSAKRTRP